MARVVLLEFEDDGAAERFVDHMSNRNGAGALNQASIAIAYSSVTHVFAKPVNFCKCNLPNKTPKGTFGKGKKFGWWVHKKCGRPLERPWGTETGLRTLLYYGRNLLDDIKNRNKE